MTASLSHSPPAIMLFLLPTSSIVLFPTSNSLRSLLGCLLFNLDTGLSLRQWNFSHGFLFFTVLLSSISICILFSQVTSCNLWDSSERTQNLFCTVLKKIRAASFQSDVFSLLGEKLLISTHDQSRYFRSRLIVDVLKFEDSTSANWYKWKSWWCTSTVILMESPMEPNVGQKEYSFGKKNWNKKKL